MSETMNIYAEKGAKLVFLNRNGRDHESAEARKHGLTEGAIYTVERTEVGGWYTDVYLQEFPDKSFNSVMFADYKPASLEIKRITPEQVFAAYQATGVVPIQDEWFRTIDGQKCACGLSAVQVAQAADTEVGFQDIVMQGDIEEFLSNTLELKKDYLRGFIYGFDGSSLSERADDTFKLGWKDGYDSWWKVKHLAVSDEG